MSRMLLRALLVTLATLSIGVGSAAAKGGHYLFDGGTLQQRAQVIAALEASTFPWGIVPQQIVINIAPGLPSAATPGRISLDADLLDSGSFAWGVIQHEYAHQVDFFLLDAAQRAILLTKLGGRDWCYSTPRLDHADYGCERFASILAWVYWPSPENALRPDGPHPESGTLPAKRFKALLGQLLGTPTATLAAVFAKPRPVPAAVALAPPWTTASRPAISARRCCSRAVSRQPSTSKKPSRSYREAWRCRNSPTISAYACGWANGEVVRACGTRANSTSGIVASTRSSCLRRKPWAAPPESSSVGQAIEASRGLTS